MEIRFKGPKQMVDQVSLVDFPPADLSSGTSDLAEVIAAQPNNTVLLNRDEYQMHEGAVTIRAVLTMSNILRQGRERSQHGVGIYQMILRSREYQDMPTILGVKPYDESSPGQCTYGTAAASISHEWGAYSYLSQMTPDLQTFYPVGIWKNRQGIPQSLTFYEHRVLTYDQVFWANKRSAPKLSEGRIINAIGRCLFATGFLLGIGMVSNDNQPKT